MQRTWKLKNLDCARRASTVRSAVAALRGVSRVRVDFPLGRMSVESGEEAGEEFWKQVEETAKASASGVEMRVMVDGICPYCNHEHCVCGVIAEKRGFDVTLALIIVSLILFLLSLLLKNPPLALVVYLLVGSEILWKAVRNLFRGKLLDENFLMAVASLGALFLSDFQEAAAVMLFYRMGEYFEDRAVDASRRSIADMLDLKSDTALVVGADGRERVCRCEEVESGMTIKVKSGGKIPLDGIVLSGASFIDTASLTGESVPRRVKEGDEVVSGCVNTEGVLTIRVTKRYEDSTVRQILSLVEESSRNKARSERFITRFAKWYTPSVVLASLLLAVVPSLFTGAWSVWVYRALTFLVISCPCALVISLPLSFFAGMGRLAQRGVMVKGGNHLEALSECETIVFDKTGTLTEGSFRLREIVPSPSFSRERVGEYASALERESSHPIAKAIAVIPTSLRATNVEEIAGKGIIGEVEGRLVACGSERLMEERGVTVSGHPGFQGSLVHLSVGTSYAGALRVSDTIREGAREAMGKLRKSGIRHIVMLTGDGKGNADFVAREIGIDTVRANLLPTDKVASFREIREKFGRSAYVGDGVNDAPVLSLCDCGIAMGGMGSDAAISASDIVIMGDDITRVADALDTARRTRRVVRENIVFALGVKALAMVLGALGITGISLAIFADVGVAMLDILNSLRLLLTRRR